MIKGIIYNLFARGLFILSGYLIHISLGRYLGPKEYGIFGVILSFLDINQIFLADGIRQAISKFVAENPNNAWPILKSGLKIQATLALLIVSLYFILSNQIAILLGDSDIARYIRITVLVIPFIGFYLASLGALNGKREFDKEALVMSIYAISRALAVLMLAIVFVQGVAGAISGSFIAAFLAFGLGLFLIWSERAERKKSSFPVKKIISFALPITLFFLGVTLLMNIDLLMVKKFLSPQSAGFYTAATVFAKTPYFLFYAFSAIALPTISGSYAKNSGELLKRQVKRINKYLVLIGLPLVLLMNATSLPLIQLFYSPAYLPASQPLSILALGVFFLAVTVTLATIMMAIDKSRTAAKIIFTLAGIDFILNYLLIPQHKLRGAALATTLTSALGMTLSGIYIHSKLKALIEPGSLIKITLASLSIYILAKSLLFSDWRLLGVYILLGGLYLSLLLFFKEITTEEIKRGIESIRRLKLKMRKC